MCFERHTESIIAFIWIIGIINTLFQFNRLYGRDCDNIAEDCPLYPLQ
jgi:hypothetical protein